MMFKDHVLRAIKEYFALIVRLVIPELEKINVQHVLKSGGFY
jgi:hypothetical protein